MELHRQLAEGQKRRERWQRRLPGRRLGRTAVAGMSPARALMSRRRVPTPGRGPVRSSKGSMLMRTLWSGVPNEPSLRCSTISSRTW